LRAAPYPVIVRGGVGETGPTERGEGRGMIEPLLLAATPIITFEDERRLTNATGFFFRRDDRLFLATSRHVVIDEPTGHVPTSLSIELHTNADNLAEAADFLIPLYRNGRAVWRQGEDSSGEIDVAVIEIDVSALPATAVYAAFTPEHLVDPALLPEVGSSLLIVGFPLGFYDRLHHLPVVRQAVIASSFGFRFQGEGYFLTDARTHRGTSGAPVAMRVHKPAITRSLGALPWLLLGVHSARLDVGTRDLKLDEALGLNCAWYADILMTLTTR
jgi:S1-C subfamily serine protease